jgi:hypothetical protein
VGKVKRAHTQINQHTNTHSRPPVVVEDNGEEGREGNHG